MTFVLARSQAAAETMMAQLQYPKHHATYVDTPYALRGACSWSILLMLPGSEHNPMYDDILLAARSNQMQIYRVVEELRA